MKNILLILMVFGSFGAFANSGYELVDYQDPKVDEQGEFYIGDMVFISTYGYLKPCIIPLKQFKIGKNLKRVEKRITNDSYRKRVGHKELFKISKNFKRVEERIKDDSHHKRVGHKEQFKDETN